MPSEDDFHLEKRIEGKVEEELVVGWTKGEVRESKERDEGRIRTNWKGGEGATVNRGNEGDRKIERK